MPIGLLGQNPPPISTNALHGATALTLAAYDPPGRKPFLQVATPASLIGVLIPTRPQRTATF